MTEDERAAREWLEDAENKTLRRINYGANFHHSPSDDARHRATILRLLDRPVLPKGSEVPDGIILQMVDSYYADGGSSVSRMRAAIDALHAHLTAPPKPKKFECWGVVFEDGQIITGVSEKYARDTARLYPGSRVVKLVEAADADA